MAKIIKKAYSFDGWEFWQFLRGRKRVAVAILGAALGYVITDSAVVATVSGAAVEMAFSLGDYFIAEYWK